MSAPAQTAPIAVSVAANQQADRVIYTFGGQSYGLSVEDAAILVSQSLDAIDTLRPPAAPGVVQ